MICLAIRPSAFSFLMNAAFGRCIGSESPVWGRKMRYNAMRTATLLKQTGLGEWNLVVLLLQDH